MGNHFQVTQIIRETNHLITLVIEANHQSKKIHENSHKIDIVYQIVKTIIIGTTIHDQTLGIDTIQTIDHETHLTIEIGINPPIGIEAIHIIEISAIKTTDQAINQTTDQNIEEPTTMTIKIDHEITHEIKTQTTTINEGIIRNLLIGITTVTPIPKTCIEATYQNIKGKLIKYKKLKKQNQIPLVLIVQKVLNYN